MYKLFAGLFAGIFQSLFSVGLVIGVIWLVIRLFCPSHARKSLKDYVFDQKEKYKSPPALTDFLRESTKDQLQGNYVTFVDNVRFINDVIDQLFSARLLNRSQKEELQSLPSDRERSKRVFDSIVMRGTYNDLTLVRKALQDSNNGYIAQLIPDVQGASTTSTPAPPGDTPAQHQTPGGFDELKKTLNDHHLKFRQLAQQIQDLQNRNQPSTEIKAQAEKINGQIKEQLSNIERHNKNITREFYREIEDKYKIYQRALGDVIRQVDHHGRHLQTERKKSDANQDLIKNCLKALQIDVDRQMEDLKHRQMLCDIQMQEVIKNNEDFKRDQRFRLNAAKSAMSGSLPVAEQRFHGFRAYVDLHHGVHENEYLCFSRVDYETSSCFDKEKGWFICPSDGVYVFSLSVTLAKGGMTCSLLQNGEPRARLVCKADCGSATICLQLLCNIKDTVSIKVVETQLGIVSFGQDNDYLGTCFSGYRQPYKVPV